MIPGPTNSELFVRFRDHECEESFRRLFERTAPILQRLAERWASPHGDAEELVQATYATAIEKARRFDPRQSVVAWMAGILLNHRRMAHRAAARRCPQLAERPYAPPPEFRLVGEEDRERLLQGVAGLPGRYREVVEQHFLHQVSIAAIAARTGRPKSTVSTQLGRGLALLRRGLSSVSGAFGNS